MLSKSAVRSNCSKSKKALGADGVGEAAVGRSGGVRAPGRAARRSLPPAEERHGRRGAAVLRVARAPALRRGAVRRLVERFDFEPYSDFSAK